MAQALSKLPVGAKVKSNNTKYYGVPIRFVVGHQDTANGRTKLITERIISIKPFDAKEPTYPTELDPLVSLYGYGEYQYSNIDQWLNSRSPGNSWYTKPPNHNSDEPPTNAFVLNGENDYYSENGFLYNFESDFYNAIKQTTMRCSDFSPTTFYTITRKVYLPSSTEVGGTPDGNAPEGDCWSLFSNNASRNCYPTEEAVNRSEHKNQYLKSTEPWYWWLRTPSRDVRYRARTVAMGGGFTASMAYNGGVGVRPALELANNQLVSNTTDSDGCYTFIWNPVPVTPPYITVPNTINGGSAADIQWGTSDDPYGIISGYILQRSVNGGEWTQIYKGADTSYLDNINFGISTIQYRVCAYDIQNETSEYRTSAIRNVINNQPPVISGADGSLGIKSDVFSQTYSVTDAESDVVTVQELIDDVEIRSHVVTLDAINTFQVTGDAWLRLSNGTHTLKIKAADTANNTSVRTYTFTKSVNSFTIQNTTPYTATECPTRIKIYVTREIPAEAAFEVKVCNNGFDDTPVWEDATAAVENNLVYVFTNQVKTAPNWGVNVKVSVSRGTGEGACYVYQIGGNFDGKTGTAEPGGEGDLTNYYNKIETDDLLEDKQDKLTAGDDVTITDNIISAPSIVFTVTIPVSAWDSGQAVVNNDNFVLTGVDSTESAYYIDPETPPEIKLKSVAQNSGTFEYTGAVPSAPVTIKIERRFVKAV